MSHFVGFCFGDYWEDNLEQYYEGLEVEAYVAYTKDEAIDEIKRNHAANYEHAVTQLNKSDLSESNKKYYESVIDKGLFISYEDAWKEAQNWGYQIDENENLLSTYNPDSKWDWYSVGGRWSNWLVVKERNEDGSIIETNQADIHEIDWDYMFEHDRVPFCFVDINGEWNEKGEMGWWGMTRNEKDPSNWREQVKEYISQFKEDEECLITIVDFHI